MLPGFRSGGTRAIVAQLTTRVETGNVERLANRVARIRPTKAGAGPAITDVPQVTQRTSQSIALQSIIERAEQFEFLFDHARDQEMLANVLFSAPTKFGCAFPIL